MREKSIKKNYIYNVCYQILLLITPLITTPYVSRVLGADNIGIYSYTNSIVSYFAMFAVLGTGIYGQREISYFQDDRQSRSRAFWSAFLLRCLATAAAVAAYMVFISLQTKYKILYVILAINLIAVAADVSWFFQGMEEFGKIVGRNVVFKLLNIMFIFIFVRQKSDLPVYIAGICILTLLSNISLWPYLKKYICRVPVSEMRIGANLGTVLSLFIPTVAIQVYTVLDKTMIGAITKDAFQNGYYEQAEKISKTALTVVTSLGTVMIPRIGYYFAQGRKDDVRLYMYRSYRFVWFMGIPLSLGLIGIASNLVPWFFGTGYDGVVPVLRVLSLLILAIGISNVTGLQYLIPTQRQNLFTLSVSLGAIVNFTCNYFMIQRWAAVGAAVASVIAEAVIAVYQLCLVKKELDGLRVICMSVHYWIAGGAMALVLYFESVRFTPGILHTFEMILTGAAVYFGMLLILRDAFFIENMKKIIHRLINIRQ